jgi:hypothetical protein
MRKIWEEHASLINLSQDNVQCEPSKRRRSDFMKSFIFWDITLSSLLRVGRGFGGTCLLATYFMLVPCLPFTSTQGTFSSVSFQRTHVVLSQKKERFITASVRISNSIEQSCSALKELIISINHKSI